MSRRGKLEKGKGRRERGSFLRLPHAVMRSPNFVALSAHAKALLLDLAVEYNGRNNGDLAAAWSMMERRGWKSRQTLYKAIRELLHYGMIQRTRGGGKHFASLYALSWEAVDDCDGKLQVPATRVPSGTWRNPVGSMPPAKKRQHDRRVNSSGISTTGVSIPTEKDAISTTGVSVEDIAA